MTTSDHTNNNEKIMTDRLQQCRATSSRPTAHPHQRCCAKGHGDRACGCVVRSGARTNGEEGRLMFLFCFCLFLRESRAPR